MKKWKVSFVFGSHFVPFIERRGSLIKKHVDSTVESACVLSWHWVHVAGFHHVHWWGHQSGAESRRESCREVTRHVICWRRARERFKGAIVRGWGACPCLSSSCASGWALWWCRTSPARSSSRWSYGRCWAECLKHMWISQTHTSKEQIKMASLPYISSPAHVHMFKRSF